MVTGLLVAVQISVGAATTHGDVVTFGKVTCSTTTGISQMMDISAQAVVENSVGLSAAYSDTIPGGTATLPATGAGLPIHDFKNLSQTYWFAPSAGSVQITSADTVPPGATAVNNGQNRTFQVSFSNSGISRTITAATWASANGGTLTFTTSVPHGFVAGQVISTVGNTPAGYNKNVFPITTVPTTTTFTMTQVGSTNPGAITVKGTADTVTALRLNTPGGTTPATAVTPGTLTTRRWWST